MKKTTDDKLSPFMSYNSIPIKSGDMPNVSTFTGNLAWFPGECPFIGKFEGKFKRKRNMLCSQVCFSAGFDEIQNLFLGSQTNERSKDKKETS